MHPITTHARTLAGFSLHIWRRFDADDCPRSAAALTYMTLFAVVPLLTVMYAMAAAVPTFEQLGERIQSYVFMHFVPATGREVQDYLLEFSQQARRLTGAGVAFLVITSVLMMRNIEKTLNAIWRTRDNRSFLNSFLLYWAILSLGPLLIGMGLGISTYLLSAPLWQGPVQGLRGILLMLAPLALTAAAFTLVFAAVPNRRVPLRHAAIGGLLCALVFELAKHLFALLVSRTSYQVIYGAFAAIPLFLLWVYLSWTIVLMGAEVVYALSGVDSRYSRRLPDWAVCLALLKRLQDHHRAGTGLPERALLQRHWLPGATPLSADRWARLRDLLLDAGLIRTASNGDYLLSRDLSRVTLLDVLQLLQRWPESCADTAPDCAWLARTQARIDTVNTVADTHLRQPLQTLFEEDPRHASPAAGH